MDIPNELAGRFVLGAEIVSRPSCRVYKANDKTLGNKEVAVKVFVDRPQGNADWISRFDADVALLRSVSHRALVPVVAGGCEQDWFYIAMQYLPGPTLRDFIKGKGGPLNIDMAVEMASLLAGALGEIHEKNSYHGHLDSRGILFKDNEVRLAGYYPRVLHQIQRGVTNAGRLLIDPTYIAPEQISDSETVDHRADIFALAVLLYEMVTGERPFVSENQLQLAMMRLTKTPVAPAKLNSSISPLLDAAIMKGLAKERGERFSSMAELVDAITGGKKPVKNPLFTAASGGEAPERLSTETIAVSMSTDAIKQILSQHSTKQAQAKPVIEKSNIVPTPVNAVSREEVSGTVTGLSARSNAQPLDVAATSMGMQAQGLPQASLLQLSGSDRGKKFLLERNQVIIGSDVGCEICVSGKGIPARYALVIRRESDFYLAPLSSARLKINGEDVDKKAEEVLLKRGDILNVGEEELRFIAPGEVFSLKEGVVDRVIDRPRSKLPFILAAVTGTVVVLSFMLYLKFRDEQASQKQKVKQAQTEKAKIRQETIDTLRREGDEFFKNGALVEPVGANARKRFEQILEIEPEDTYAKRRLGEIEDRVRALGDQERRRKQFAEQIEKLLSDGERYFKAGNYISPPGTNAREMYQEVLRFDPQNQIAQQQLGEINRILSDFVGRVNELLAKAKGYAELGQYISPSGENAYELIDQVLNMDEGNKQAHALLVEMAALSIIEADAAKSSLSAKRAEEAYRTAGALGADPEYIAEKLKGLDLIVKGKDSEYVVVDRGKTKKSTDSGKDGGARELTKEEIEQRIFVLTSQSKGKIRPQGDKRFIEIPR